MSAVTFRVTGILLNFVALFMGNYILAGRQYLLYLLALPIVPLWIFIEDFGRKNIFYDIIFWTVCVILVLMYILSVVMIFYENNKNALSLRLFIIRLLWCFSPYLLYALGLYYLAAL